MTTSIQNKDQTGTPYGIRRLATASDTLKDNTPVVAFSDSDGNPVNAQFPIQVDGDSVYSKDVDASLSDIGTFEGDNDDLLLLFNDYESEIIDESGENPKTFTLRFFRPIKSNQVALGSKTGTFSNVKVQLKDLAGTVRTVIDDSANDTDLSSNIYPFTTNVFIEAVIEFHTADAVKVSGMYIPKVQSRAISNIDGFISAENSSLTPLGIAGVFQGEAENSRDYGAIQVALYSDQDCTFLIEARATPTSAWREIDTYQVAAGEDKAWSFQGVRQFIRITVTNGAIAQTDFDLQVMLKPVYIKPSSHPMGGVLKSNDDAEAVKAGIAGFSEIDGEPENVSTFRRALQVDNALVHRAGVNELFTQIGTTTTTLAVAASVGDTDINVVSAAAFSIGDQFIMNSELFHFHITDITVNNIQLDRPVDFAHAIGTAITDITNNMAVVGSLVAPVSFKVAPPSNEIWQLTRIIPVISASTAMDDGKFGGIAALTNGAVLRAYRNGIFRTGAVWKTNGDMALDMYNLDYTTKAPAGENGMRGRWTFTNAEFVVELDGATGDYTEILIQDDTSANTGFYIKAQGRIFGA